ncbi:unnamed protein product [Gordionus sp. m RMFG-2023]
MTTGWLFRYGASNMKYQKQSFNTMNLQRVRVKSLTERIKILGANNQSLIFIDEINHNNYMDYNFNIKDILEDSEVGSTSPPNLGIINNVDEYSKILRSLSQEGGPQKYYGNHHKDSYDNYVTLDENYLYEVKGSQSLKIPLTLSQKYVITSAINESLFHLIKKYPHMIDYQVLDIYWLHVSRWGFQYILDFNIQISSESSAITEQAKPKSISNKTVNRVVKRIVYAKLFNPFSDILSVYDLKQREDSLTIIIPVSESDILIQWLHDFKNQGLDITDERYLVWKVERLVHKIAGICDSKVNLLFSLKSSKISNGPFKNSQKPVKKSKSFSPLGSSPSSENDILSKAVGKLLNKFTHLCEEIEIQIVSLADPIMANRARAVNAAISALNDDSLMMLGDLDIDFSLDFLARCRHNTIYSKMVFFPIPLQDSNLILHSEEGHPDLLLKPSSQYDIVCLYKDDYTYVKGYNLTNKMAGKEESDLYQKYLESDLKIFRAPDIGLFHTSDSLECLQNDRILKSSRSFAKCVDKYFRIKGKNRTLAIDMIKELYILNKGAIK